MLVSTVERVEKELGHLWSPKNKVAVEDVKNIRNKVWWRCEKGHDYERTAKNMSTHIRRGYASCPICMNREVLTGFNDLAHKFPELAKEYSPNNDVPANKIISGACRKVEWVCSKNKNHVWKARVKSRTLDGRGCEQCHLENNTYRVSEERTLAFKFPELAKEYSINNELPSDVIAFGSDKKVEWVCSKDSRHVWSSKVSKRTDKHHSSGCPYCAGRKLISGVNDLATIHPKVAKEYSASNEIPVNEIAANSNKKAEWICSKNSNHVWSTRIHRRTNVKKSTGCPYCARLKNSSKGEDELFTFISSLLPGVDIVRNDRKLLASRKELDIYIPELGIAFEFNGLYWHSLGNVGSDKNYHYNKFKDAKDNNVQLFTIWSCDWDERKSLVKRLVKQVISNAVNVRNDNNKDKTGNMSEKTGSSFESNDFTVKTLTTSAAQDFHNKNNTNLFVNKGVHYALFDNDNIMRAILTVNKEDDGMKIHNVAFSSVSGKKQLLALKTLLSCAHNESIFSQCKQVTACVSNDFLCNVFLLEKLGFSFSGYRGARKISSPKFTSREIVSNESSDDNCKEIIYDCGMSIYAKMC